MSVTYSIGCQQCKKVLWVGQRHTLYGSEVVNTMQFLKHHTKHALIFDEDCNSETFDNYESVDEQYKPEIKLP